MLHRTITDYDFRHAMCQWSDDYTTDRQYGDARWSRLGKRAEAISQNWDLSEDWDELAPDDIVTLGEYH